MRYFALGNKANIKITDDNLTLEDIINDAIKWKIVTPEESDQIREIQRDEFIKPINVVGKPKVIVNEEEDVVPSWKSIMSDLKKKK